MFEWGWRQCLSCVGHKQLDKVSSFILKRCFEDQISWQGGVDGREREEGHDRKHVTDGRATFWLLGRNKHLTPLTAYRSHGCTFFINVKKSYVPSSLQHAAIMPSKCLNALL